MKKVIKDRSKDQRNKEIKGGKMEGRNEIKKEGMKSGKDE